MAEDPVCGMEVNERQAAATAQHQGHTYHFCCADCKREFDRSSGRYAQPTV
jgi:Cu+-exporting ATPase